MGLATNAVYIESAQFIPKGGDKTKFGEMVLSFFILIFHLFCLDSVDKRTYLQQVIDMQWGNFNTPHLPITQFDMALDAESSNNGSRVQALNPKHHALVQQLLYKYISFIKNLIVFPFQLLEKLIGGRYLGEVVRRVLLKMATETALFGETVPAKLKTPYILR